MLQTKIKELSHIAEKNNHLKSKCFKAFGQKINLKRHMNTVHLKLKLHKCGECGKSFSEAGNLKRHNQTVHDGIKDYKCESCGKSFPY